MKSERVFRIIVLLGMTLLLAGCWNRRELKELAIVSAIGIDKTTKANEVKVTFQIINPSTVATGIAGGAGGQQPAPVTVYSGTGETLFEAIRKTSQKVPRQLFFAHMQLLILGESYTREGIQDLFDFLERSDEVRLTTLVLVARESEAESLIRILTPLEKIPANSIAGKIKTSSKVWSESIKVEMDEVIRSLVSKGDPMITGVKIAGDPKAGNKTTNIKQTNLPAQLDISGIALFKNGMLKRWLEGDEARGAVWLTNKMKSTIIDLDCNERKDAVGIEIVRSHTDIKAEIQEREKPVFHISIREEGNISEVRCPPMDISKVEEIMFLEAKWKTKTRKEVLAALKAAQNERSDIFGFGEAVNRANPKAWKEMKQDWGAIFAESKIDVKVDAYIRRSGMRLKPYMSEHEGTANE
ncbi:Ger(x)C family spore germination protein [Paenibacillus sp. OAS669]|uniref:Ger(x)C family spore germination protein n=1 Tax=Paenibacillus sp. OAS669 TaxID=2663821 RepID=UPI00178C060E|nr:Ger(x)C family spore germination protein [Paenibacillus sp. OAS669]MBE1445907.1 spore germination protein KC [Paenibacillus sp. OAS669]